MDLCEFYISSYSLLLMRDFLKLLANSYALYVVVLYYWYNLES